MKLFRLFQKSPSFNTQSISCCELTQFDCNQGRNCPLRASVPSLQTKRGNPVPAPLNASSHKPPAPATHAAPSATAADFGPSNTRSAVLLRPKAPAHAPGNCPDCVTSTILTVCRDSCPAIDKTKPQKRKRSPKAPCTFKTIGI